MTRKWSTTLSGTDLLPALSDWAFNAAPKVRREAPQSVHIDELSSDRKVKFSYEEVCEMMETLLARLAGFDRISPMLVIPLECSEALDTHATTVTKALEYSVDAFEPLSLYLIDESTHTPPLSAESYVFPLGNGAVRTKAASSWMLASFYCCFRPLEISDADTEYERCVYMRAMRAR